MIHHKELFFKNVDLIEESGFVQKESRKVFPDEALATWIASQSPTFSIFYSVESDKACLGLLQAPMNEAVYEQKFEAHRDPRLFLLNLLPHITGPGPT